MKIEEELARIQLNCDQAIQQMRHMNRQMARRAARLRQLDAIKRRQRAKVREQQAMVREQQVKDGQGVAQISPVLSRS